MGPAAAQPQPAAPERTDLSRLIEDGVKRGVARALAEHKRAGRSVVVMKDGKIVELSPEDIPDTGVEDSDPSGGHRLRVL